MHGTSSLEGRNSCLFVCPASKKYIIYLHLSMHGTNSLEGGNFCLFVCPASKKYIIYLHLSMHERKRNNSKCMELPRPDGCKIALVIEGGGMRGCVSAGMACAIYYLGLRETIDVVYGCSAGSVVGAYFITEQLPWFGPEVYYDKLTTAGKSFIDTKRRK